MSRLYPYGPAGFGGADLFDPERFANPMLRFLRPPEPTVNDLLPKLSPEDEKSYLGRTLEGGLGGLAYLGKLADKTFGGRAIRGVLGGNAREALSVLPLSDTLGLTREEDTVRGRDLLTKAGLQSADPDPKEFNLSDLPGAALEVALDPSTYLGFGALTKGGAALDKAGGLAGFGLRDKLAGGIAREGDLRTLAATMGQGVEPADVLRQLGLKGAVIPDAADAAARAAGHVIEPQYTLRPGPMLGLEKNAVPPTPLAGLLGAGLPFTRPTAVAGIGESGLSALDRLASLGSAVAAPARLLDKGVQKVTGLSPLSGLSTLGNAAGRSVNALYNPDVQGAWSGAGQEAGRFATSLETPLKRESLGRFADYSNELRPLYNNTPRDQLLSEALVEAIERPTGVKLGIQNGGMPLVMAKLPDSPTPALDQILGRGQHIGTGGLLTREERRAFGNVTRAATRDQASDLARELDLGVNAHPMSSEYTKGYLLRRRAELGDNADAAGELADFLTPEARTWAAKHGSLIGRQDIFDVPGGTTMVNRWAKDPLISGPTGRPGMMTKADRLRYLREQLSGMTNPPATHPAHIQAAQIADWLESLPKTFGENGVDFFNLDLPSNLLVRSTRADRAEAAARTVYEGVARFAKPTAQIEAEGHTPFPVKKLLSQMGLTHDPGLGVRTAEQIVSNRTGTPLNALGDLAVPAEMAQDIVRMHEAYTTPKALQPVIDAYDAVSRTYKAGLTRPFPGFHARNLISNLFQMWRGGVLEPTDVAGFKDLGARVQSYLKGGALNSKLGLSNDDFWKELVQAGIMDRRTGMNADVVGNAGELVRAGIRYPEDTGRSTLGDVGNAIRQGFTKDALLRPGSVEEFGPIKAGTAVGQMIEDWSRATHYLGLREKGFDPAKAAAEVAKYQLDYGNLTRWEKAVMRRVMPWYSFSRRSLPTILEDLVSQPGKITGPLRAVSGLREPGEYVPGYIAEGASLPIPGGPEGSQRYVTSFGLPIEDESLKAFGSLAQGDVTRGLGSLLGMTMPVIKTPIEAATNRSLFTGRPLEELQPYQWSQASGLLDERKARLLSEAIAGTPASRVASTIDKAADVRKGPLAKAFNLLTGVKVSDVDVQKARDAEAKRMLADVLRGQPGVRSASEVYIPKDRLPDISPEQAILYRLMLSADQRLREQAAERRAAGR